MAHYTIQWLNFVVHFYLKERPISLPMVPMSDINKKYGVSLAQEFQHHLTKEHRKNGVIDQVKYKKWFMERKLTDRQYHV